MVTKFKIFEGVEHDVPEQDDWIIFAKFGQPTWSEGFCDFLKNNIGQIISSRLTSSDIVYFIQYDKRFNSKNEFSLAIEHNEISNLIWSSDRKKLERILTQRQFDL